MRKLFFVALFFIGLFLLSPNSAFAQREAEARICAQGMICGEVDLFIGDKTDQDDDMLMVSTDFVLKTKSRVYRLEGNLENLEYAIGETVGVVARVGRNRNRLNVIKHDFVPSTDERSVRPRFNIEQFPSAVNTPFVLPGATTGARKTRIVMVKFQGQADPTAYNANSLAVAAFTGNYSTNNFLWSASWGLFSLDGSVDPDIVTLPVPPGEDCTEAMLNEWPAYVDQVRITDPLYQAAKSRVIIYPEMPGCNLTALGGVGQKGNPDIVKYVYIQMTPASVQNNLQKFTSTLAHEIGHNIGIGQHSGGINPDGTTNDSGDRGCFMASRFRYPNIYTRLALGWFNGRMTVLNGPNFNTEDPNEILPYQVNLFPTDQIAGSRTVNGRNGVVIQLKNADGTPNGKIMLLEVRRNRSYDDFVQSYWYADGLGIRIADANASTGLSRSYIYDTKPGTIFGFDDAPLDVGETIIFQEYGVEITVLYRTMIQGTRVSIKLLR